MEIIHNLKRRGILKDITNEAKINKLPKNARVYIGFDPTAESLHLGNYIQISILQRFKKIGINPIAVIGGATGMVGDPSGVFKERKLLNNATLIKNKSKIKKQLESFGLQVVDNYDFYKNMNIFEFLRGPGKLLNINYMINKEVVKSRLENGISFTEFSYQLLQGWDFKCLYEDYNAMIQIGGSDQWGNITSGVEIIRKTIGDNNNAVGITTNLLTNSSGIKFGKSEGTESLWLSKDMCSPYKMYQFLLNINDEDVEKLLMWFSFKKIKEIFEIMTTHKTKPFKRLAQKELAKTIITNIHSKEDFNQVESLSKMLFSDNLINLKTKDYMQLDGVIPTIVSAEKKIEKLLVIACISCSKSHSRRLLEQKAISINGEIMSEKSILKQNDFLLIKKGKKKYFLIKRK